jgi:hypothetical protein
MSTTTSESEGVVPLVIFLASSGKGKQWGVAFGQSPCEGAEGAARARQAAFPQAGQMAKVS